MITKNRKKDVGKGGNTEVRERNLTNNWKRKEKTKPERK